MKLTTALLAFLLIICIAGTNGLVRKTRDVVTYPLAQNNLRGMREIWGSIRDTTIESWNYVKQFAQTIQERIRGYIEEVSEYANQVKATVENQMERLRDRFNAILEDFQNTRELISTCSQRHTDNISQLIGDVRQEMSFCIRNEIQTLMQISGRYLELDDKEYIEDVGNKFTACESLAEDIDECMNLVKNNVIYDIAEMEEKYRKTDEMARNLADKAKNTVVSCSIHNIADASYFISQEVTEIAKCVTDTNIYNAIIE